MNTLTRLGTEIFQWVFETTWQAAVLVGLVLLAQWLFRKRLSPAWRYAIWLLLVARLLMPSLPKTSFSVFNMARLELQRSRIHQPQTRTASKTDANSFFESSENGQRLAPGPITA